MRWIDRTHGTRFELMRHFLATMFDSEMFSTRGQWATIAIGAFGMVVPAGMILLESPSGRKLAISAQPAQAMALADRLSSLTLLLSITAILALLAWQSLFPSRRDYLALAALPVRSRQIFTARFACVLLMAGVITFLLLLPPGASPPHPIKLATGPAWMPHSTAAARMTATAFGCIFIFFVLVGLNGLIINTLPARWVARCAGPIQGFLLGAALLMALYSWFIPEWSAPAVPKLLRGFAWAPPVWFLGLHEKLSGTTDLFFLSLAARATRATAAAVAFAALMYVTASVRFRRLLLEAGEGLAPQRMRERRWLRLVARNPQQEAILQFVAAVLSRSRVHRMVLMAYAGAGLAVMVNAILLNGRQHIPQFVFLYWPLGFSFVSLAGIRHAFVMPAEWKANWLFRVTESQGRREWMRAVERFVIVCIIAPIHLLSLPGSAALLGLPTALRLTFLQALVSLAVFEFLFYSWQQLPFTCSYVPGKSSLMLQLGAWLVVLNMVVPLIARMVAALAQMPAIFVVYSTAFVALWIWARRRRRDGWGEAPLIYEDTHGLPPDLGIREMSFGGVRRDGLDPEPPVPLVQSEPEPEPALRVHDSIARLFPQEFRESFGEEMNRTAKDAIHDIGAARLLSDTAFRVVAENAAQFGRDFKYSLRTLAGSPGFTAVALISLSLSICIATCGFSEMNGMVLRDLPGAAHPDQLISLQRPVSYPAYRRFHAREDLFFSSAAYISAVPFGVALYGHTERVWGHLVAPTYFSTFGITPAIGRFFTSDANPRVAVISHRFWKEHFAADPTIAGRTVRINGQPVTILGVAAPDFLGAMPVTPADLFLPLPPDPSIEPALTASALERSDFAAISVVARLQAWTTMAAAEAALDAVVRQFERDTGDPNRDRPGRRITLVEGGKCIPLRKQDKPFFTTFFTVMAGLIMMIACANVANMMLARAASRRREIAVRLALGAGRGCIVRQLLTESGLIAGAAGVVGAIASAWLMRAAGELRMPLPIPVTYGFLTPDLRVLLLTLVLSLITGIVFGLAPALQATRADLTPALKEGGSVQVHRHRRLSLRNVLMVSQMAGSLTLLVIVGYLSVGIQSKLGLQAGFNPASLFLISLDPTKDGYTPERSAAFFPKLLDRVQALPTVTTASLSVSVPVSMRYDQVTFAIPGKTRTVNLAVRHIVGKDYFATTGIRILAGRAFRLAEETEDSTSVIVSETFAKEFWQGQDALGRKLEIADSEMLLGGLFPSPTRFRPRMSVRGTKIFEVIGIAHDVAEDLIANRPHPAIYFPVRPSDFAQPAQQGITLIVRARPGVDAVQLVRREIDAIDTNITPFYAGSMMQHIDEFMSPLRAASWTYGVIGFFGLILAAVGLAGMTAYSVASRQHEIGIRMALGAGHGRVLGLIMKEGTLLIAIGLAIGIAGAWAASRLLVAMSTEVGQVASTSSNDPLIVFGAPLLLAAMALAACYVPARRSLRVDPVITLRQE
jgi:predicted permease